MSTRATKKTAAAPTVVQAPAAAAAPAGGVNWETVLTAAADAVKIQRISLVPKDIAKGMSDAAKAARAKCPRGGYMYGGKCVRLEDALLQCDAAGGVSVSNNQLQCGGGAINVPAGSLNQTAKMVAEGTIFTQEHNLKVNYLQNSFRKRIYDRSVEIANSEAAANTRYSIMREKVRMSGKSAAEETLALKNIQSEQEIALRVFDTKISEGELKLQQAISEAFPRLLESTLRRLDQLSKSHKILLLINMASGSKRVAGLSKVSQPKPPASQSPSLLSAPPKKRRTTRRKKCVRRV